MRINTFHDIRRASIRIAGIMVFAMFCCNLFAATSTEMIKNGDFSSTVVTNWTLKVADTANVKGAITGGQYVITRKVKAIATDTNDWGVQFSQNGLNIEKGKSYIASFCAKGDTDFIAKVNVGKNTGAPPYSDYKPFPITKVLDTFSFAFKMDSATDADARIAFDLGFMCIKGTITLDNISLKPDTTSTTPQPAGELVKNGTFSTTSTSPWTINIRSGSGAAATQKVVNGELEINITKMGSPDPLNYDIQLCQTGLKLEKGKDYQVTWDARSDSGYQMAVYLGMNNNTKYSDPWAMYSGYNTAVLSPTMDTTGYFTFTMDSATDAGARIALDIGDVAGGGPRKVYLDNISVVCLTCNSGVAEGVAHGKQSPRPKAALSNRNLKITGISSPATVRLYNATGETILFLGEALPVKGTVSLPLQLKMAKGIYFVKIVQQTAQKNMPSTMVRLIHQ